MQILGKIVTGIFCIYLFSCFFHSISYNSNAYILFFFFTSIISAIFFFLWKKAEHHPITKKDLPIVVGIILPSFAFFSWLIVNSIFVTFIHFDLLTYEKSQVEVDITGKSCSTTKGQVNCYLIIDGERHYLPIERLKNIQLGKAVITIKEYWLGAKVE
ncbi:hypothetical protein QWY77_11275 [Thalassotalea ponticola]|uniref:hypothetical protein n=1 Tax=Thalassotalea ponticola TaxID=1523392 RepID=UPI0025B4E278|nr:hypothetical protein [Thalassotalea ponticola]MDN3653321.1 hypothetical protein [Thalassotalea ponticola]